MRMRVCRRCAFTIVEVLVAIVIIGVALAAVLTAYSSAYGLAETSLSATAAMDAALTVAERIKGETPAAIPTKYGPAGDPGPIFAVPGLPNAAGHVDVDTSDPDVLGIVVTVCWRQKGGRVVGEDQNLDGVLSPSEDVNLNGRIDSPVTLSFRVAR